ncbi:MAG: A/G-specific adenine glycosylase [Pirellulaceae bacterium]
MSHDLPNAPWRQRFRRRLRMWYRRHARDLPWRGTSDPYAIWVSEIMLQQTQVVTVIPYYERFLAAFPTIEALAAASEDEVLRLWEGLGYYRRARQLHSASRQIVTDHHGEFPQQVEEVRSLPGIGRYTAGAILSIAWDAREPILEANTVRLLCRLLAYRGDPRQSAGQERLWSFATVLLPRNDVGEFNQALMELGSKLCTPADPTCDNCPAAPLCPTKERGWQKLVPARKKTTQYERVREAAVVIWRGGRILLRQCQGNERWAGLWDFPRFEIRAQRGNDLQRELVDNVASLIGMRVEPQNHLTTIQYGVTRFRITLSCYEAAFKSGRVANGVLRWVAPRELDSIPLSVTGRKIGDLLTAKKQ